MLAYMTVIPVLATIAGAAFAVWRRPGEIFTAAIQHLAAGAVFATASAELLPDILHSAGPLTTLVGGGAGVVVMLAIRRLEAKLSGPVGLLTGVGVDIVVDGLVLGIGFAADIRVGVLLTIAVTLEVLLLGLSSVMSLDGSGMSSRRRLVTVSALALLLPVGVFLATPVSLLPEQLRLGVLTFGLVALLFLVTEELLIEAHEVEERSWFTALFFVGFLGLILLDEMMR